MHAHTSMIAITRAVPATMAQCELTYQARTHIDVERARHQHHAYRQALAALGCEVIELAEARDLPDSVFVEDTAVVLDECAVIARPGAFSRRAETAAVRAALAPYRPLHEISAPGTLDGGDVLRLGRRLFVGLSTRTNEEAAGQLQATLRPFGYDVVPVRMTSRLHLKTAATAIADDRIVVDAGAVDPEIFGVPYLEVPAAAANLLQVNGTVLCPAGAAATGAQLEREGIRVQLIDNSEFVKAEGGLTCCSIIFPARG